MKGTPLSDIASVKSDIVYHHTSRKSSEASRLNQTSTFSQPTVQPLAPPPPPPVGRKRGRQSEASKAQRHSASEPIKQLSFEELQKQIAAGLVEGGSKEATTSSSAPPRKRGRKPKVPRMEPPTSSGSTSEPSTSEEKPLDLPKELVEVKPETEDVQSVSAMEEVPLHKAEESELVEQTEDSTEEELAPLKSAKSAEVSTVESEVVLERVESMETVEVHEPVSPQKLKSEGDRDLSEEVVENVESTLPIRQLHECPEQEEMVEEVIHCYTLLMLPMPLISVHKGQFYSARNFCYQ